MDIRFVVVDDAAFLREMIKNVLESEGALCVGESADGVGAAEIVRRVLPDVVILDMVLPQTNGIDIARDIKNLAPSVKVLACSTLDADEIIQKAKCAGADGYLVKPFSKAQLIEEVQNILK